MKVSPLQLTLIAVGTFVAIVLLDVLAQYRSNSNFREYLSSIKPEDLIPERIRRVREENMETVPVVEETENDEVTDEN